MSKAIGLLILFFSISCQHTPHRGPAASSDKLSKKQLKHHFKNLSQEERDQAIRRAQVTRPDYRPERVSSLDVVQELESLCGAQFKYQKETVEAGDPTMGLGGTYQIYRWPRIECRYQPDDADFGGYTSKFRCEFPNSKAKDGWTDKKVKYASSPQRPLKSELVETVLATTLTRLIGFYTEAYCPLTAVCKDCPSDDPWELNRSQAPGKKGNEEVFPWALVEESFSGFVMSNQVLEPMAQGLEWDELKKVDGGDARQARQMLIEREAWILWINFLQTLDAGYFNQRIYCLKASKLPNSKEQCEKSIVYTHDYGHSFHGHFNFSAWARKSVFKENSNDGLCHGNLLRSSVDRQWLKGAVFEPIISAEARDLLVDRLEQLSEKQWIQTYQLSRAEEASGVSVQSFVKAVQEKIFEMKNATCSRFDEGKSVLAIQD